MALSRQFWTTTTTRSETARTFTIVRLRDVEPTALEVQTHQRGQSLHLGIKILFAIGFGFHPAFEIKFPQFEPNEWGKFSKYVDDAV